MNLDSHTIFAGVCVFSRFTAMLMSSPIMGNQVPINVRILMSVVLSLCLVPVLQGHIGAVPLNLIQLTTSVLHEVLMGLLLGSFMQILVASMQIAGAFLDVQIGTGSAQIFNPFLGSTASPIAQFKVMLATVLIFMLNGHRMMIVAFTKSYSLSGPNLEKMQPHFLSFLGQMTLLSLQIAAPVAAVTIVIDLAAGVVNKAVPQSQPFLLSLPAKLAAGVVIMSVGLPALVTAVNSGLDITFDRLGEILGGR